MSVVENLDIDGDGEIDLIAVDLDQDGEADIVLFDPDSADPEEDWTGSNLGEDDLDLLMADLSGDQDLLVTGEESDFEFEEKDETEDPDDFSFEQETEAAEAEVDSDMDGLSDAKEEELGTNAFNEDTDGDGLLDGQEDRDRDGWYHLGWETDPLSADTDHDGIRDGAEDRDGDGLIMAGETDALNADSDFDGMVDGREDRNSDGVYDPDRGETDATDGHDYREADRESYYDSTGQANWTSEEMDGVIGDPDGDDALDGYDSPDSFDAGGSGFDQGYVDDGGLAPDIGDDDTSE